ncbi:hypothetical protein [Sporisorium scitamineum]|uniref:Secreted protein n=1 Tax=Sporisorium scitamineum TaxID=49012 RepID=A0A0F7S9N5_9BASI|nr:hypothetical protein [Sporisorium scitamineum]
MAETFLAFPFVTLQLAGACQLTSGDEVQKRTWSGDPRCAAAEQSDLVVILATSSAISVKNKST